MSHNWLIKIEKIVKVTVTIFEMIVREHVTRSVDKNRKTKKGNV